MTRVHCDGFFPDLPPTGLWTKKISCDLLGSCAVGRSVIGVPSLWNFLLPLKSFENSFVPVLSTCVVSN